MVSTRVDSRGRDVRSRGQICGVSGSVTAMAQNRDLPVLTGGARHAEHGASPTTRAQRRIPARSRAGAKRGRSRAPARRGAAMRRRIRSRRLHALARASGPLRRALARMAGRMVATRGWERLGFARLADYATERAGMSPRELRDLARVDRALEALPGLEHAFVAGELGWTQLRLAVSRRAAGERARVARPRLAPHRAGARARGAPRWISCARDASSGAGRPRGGRRAARRRDRALHARGARALVARAPGRQSGGRSRALVCRARRGGDGRGALRGGARRRAARRRQTGAAGGGGRGGRRAVGRAHRCPITRRARSVRTPNRCHTTHWSETRPSSPRPANELRTTRSPPAFVAALDARSRHRRRLRARCAAVPRGAPRDAARSRAWPSGSSGSSC